MFEHRRSPRMMQFGNRSPSWPAAVLVALAVVASACGAKTGLRVPQPPAPDVGAPDASTSFACRHVLILGAPGANPSSDFSSWLEGRGAVVVRTQTNAADGPLLRSLLDTSDLTIIDWLQRDYTPAESTVLYNWTVAGGSLIALSGHDSGATAHRQVSLLQSVGMTYVLGASYSGPATFLPATPLSDGVDAPVTFSGGLQVTTTSRYAGTSTVVATVPPNVTIGMIGALGDGRMFVFGDEWIEFDSEWSTMPAITQLWLNAIGYVDPRGSSTMQCDRVRNTRTLIAGARGRF